MKLQIKSAGNTVDLFHVHKFEQFLLQQIAETVLVAQSACKFSKNVSERYSLPSLRMRQNRRAVARILTWQQRIGIGEAELGDCSLIVTLF